MSYRFVVQKPRIVEHPGREDETSDASGSCFLLLGKSTDGWRASNARAKFAGEIDGVEFLTDNNSLLFLVRGNIGNFFLLVA